TVNSKQNTLTDYDEIKTATVCRSTADFNFSNELEFDDMPCNQSDVAHLRHQSCRTTLPPVYYQERCYSCVLPLF
ncbi:hypothetical protein CHS0354_038254, partial [Potamilus streckersoni]